ncbi:MAG: Do family serine endopeptidase [Paramuribaculum sp.]|nr:Do family serine endopeptidase [Paramuribaculum sp.]
MNINTKLGLLAFGAAVFGSATTLFAVKTTGHELNLSDNQIEATSSMNKVQKGQFLTVAERSAVETDFTKAAESTINGVVSIKSFAVPKGYSSSGNPFNDPFFEFFFGQPRQQQRQQPQEQKEQPLGLGSGVIISEDGYIVTNNHVIDGAERLEITLNDNRTFNATVVGTDPMTDLALIKIDADGLHSIPIGDSDALKVGEWVLAVGNPFGFTSTVTTGIVSAKARSISTGAERGRKMGIESYIQTDAAVNPGNSGGALVNLNGELIGINTAIYSQTGNYAGYSFAIPSAMMVKVMTDIKQYGTVQRAVLGITYQELVPELAKEKKVTAVNDGLYVVTVAENGAAEKAGIKVGDVITAVNGHETHNSAQLMEQLNRYRPGDKISITYYRDNKKETTNVTLLNSQGSTKIVQPVTVSALGAKFKKPTEELMKQLKLKYGVQISELSEGKLKKAGMKEGFIILDINNGRVNSADDVEKIYMSIMEADDEYDKVMFITGVYPNGKKVYYAVDLTD